MFLHMILLGSQKEEKKKKDLQGKGIWGGGRKKQQKNHNQRPNPVLSFHPALVYFNPTPPKSFPPQDSIFSKIRRI